ncbi:MAG: aldehyde dehydrogenase (NADP(+)) [Kiritimatiellia bacterium]
MSQELCPVLVDGEWRAAVAFGSFLAEDPATGTPLDVQYPKSEWSDVEAVIAAAAKAAEIMQEMPAQTIADFLNAYADDIEAHAVAISEQAALETGYPVKPRLQDVELPRTTGQLRQAAMAAGDASWRLPTIDAANKIASILEPVGPVVVFGPNNFPLAFNGIAGGDFAAAIAAGNPVIAKAHSSHPGTCKLLAECALRAAQKTGMPAGAVQMIFGISRADGEKLVRDGRIGAVAFTGSRTAGMALKASADAVGKPIYLEMSSVNPVVILPGALAERSADIAGELVTSALMGTGQFCTNPGLIFLVAGEATEGFLAELAEKYTAQPCGTLLSKGTQQGLVEGIEALVAGGAEVVCGGRPAARPGYAWSNTLLRVDGKHFLADPEKLQTEAFGNATLVVIAESLEQLPSLICGCEGNLTGCIYSALDGRDDAAYAPVARLLRARVGRLLNDKMPTGVAVSPAMCHGGPFPATGHPHFTAVGIPAACRRFTRLACYDNVRPDRLPVALRS